MLFQFEFFHFNHTINNVLNTFSPAWLPIIQILQKEEEPRKKKQINYFNPQKENVKSKRFIARSSSTLHLQN